MRNILVGFGLYLENCGGLISSGHPGQTLVKLCKLGILLVRMNSEQCKQSVLLHIVPREKRGFLYVVCTVRTLRIQYLV